MNAVNGEEKGILEHKEDLAGRWMFGGMVAVLVGVIIETAPDFLGAAGILRSAHRAGGSLVALGLALEFVTESLASGYRSRLRAINESVISATNSRAAAAAQAAAEANLARVKLEAMIMRRTVARVLDTDEESELINALSQYAGQKCHVRSSEFAPDARSPFDLSGEPLGFALQLQRIVRAAGWIDRNLLIPVPTVPQGVVIFTDSTLAIKAAEALCSGLTKLQISCRLILREELGGELVVGVGLL